MIEVTLWTLDLQLSLKNARSARSWVLDRLGDPAAVSAHFVAVSSNQAEVLEFGIGLSIMLAIGSTLFRELLGRFTTFILTWNLERGTREATG